jgi:hypothetical protein
MDGTTTQFEWRRSSRCSTSGCVEVKKTEHSYLVRDSSDPNSPVLSFSPLEWEAFVVGIRTGEFN